MFSLSYRVLNRHLLPISEEELLTFFVSVSHKKKGLPDVELGVNDLPRQGKEVVGRHDIIPVITEEWIRLEDVEFHHCVDQSEFENTRTVK